MNGYLVVNKPKGITSFDVVYRLRKASGRKKIGHTGTLDPLAEGLMIICFGKCTKAVSYITGFKKAYIAKMELGIISDTYDITGEITKKEAFNISCYTNDKIKETLMLFLGKQKQLPPMYSAKKVGGKKLYELARDGKEIKREPSEIEIYDISILKIEENMVEFYVSCSKGTYIRSLISDFGEKLGCGAVMTALKRVENGDFDISKIKAYELCELTNSDEINAALLPADFVFSHLKKVVINEFCEKIMKNGIPVNLSRANILNIYENDELVRVYNEKNEFLSICKITDNVLLKLEITFFDN